MIATGYAGISPVIKLDPKYFRDITENVQQMIGVVSSDREPSEPLTVLNRDLQITEAAQPIEKNIYLFTLKSSVVYLSDYVDFHLWAQSISSSTWMSSWGALLPDGLSIDVESVQWTKHVLREILLQSL